MELYPHQEVARDFLAARQHAILADAPGVGKTHSAVAALVKVGAKSALIIVPAPMPVKRAWRRIMVDFGIPADQIQIISAEHQKVGAQPFVIVNYEMLQNSAVFRAIYWAKYDAIICDEAHRMKAIGSKRSKRILGGGSESLIARGRYKWMLSGTIAPNRPAELFPILASLFPQAIARHLSWPAYTKRYCDAYEGPDGWNYNGASNIDELADALKPHLLRRNLEDVYEDIPDCIERSVYIDVGEMDEDETNTAGATLRKAIGLAKLPYIQEYVELRLIENPHKLLVFVYHREVAEMLHSGITESKLLYGGMSAKAKEHSLSTFTSDPLCRVLIAQMNAAGEAIDGMQHVCHQVIIAEPDWTQYVQQIARVRRAGQDKPVDVVTLIAEGTLDDVVVPVRKHKAKVIGQLIGTSNVVTKEKPMSLEEQVMALNANLSKNNSLLEALILVLPTGAAPNDNAVEPAKDSPKAATAAKDVKSEKKAAATGGKNTTTAPTAQPKLTADDVRAAAKEVISVLGDSAETREKVKAAVIEHGGTGKADTVPAKNIAACVAAINALVDFENVEVDDLF